MEAGIKGLTGNAINLMNNHQQMIGGFLRLLNELVCDPLTVGVSRQTSCGPYVKH